jgi:alpha-beta hydrolase superfamily lysophospholipase
VIYGESLGTAVAVKIAARREVTALVLESPFTSIPDIASAQYPGENIAPLITQIWDSIGMMSRIDEPLLVMHATGDRLVPISQGEAVFAAARSTDKAMLRIEGRDHGGVWTADGQLALYAFLDRF